MNKPPTYTLFAPPAHPDEDIVIGRGIGAVDAMRIVVGYDGKREFFTAVENYGFFRRIDWWTDPIGPLAASVGAMLQATVPLTDDYDADRAAGLDLIAAQFVRIAHHYWSGRIEDDEAYDEHLRYVADGLENERVEKEIATKLFSALIADGYAISGDFFGHHWDLPPSTDRDAILDHVVGVQKGAFEARKGGTTNRFRMTFGGDGRDLLHDYDGALGPLIEAIVGPYRPSEKTGGVGHPGERGCGTSGAAAPDEDAPPAPRPK